MRSKRALAAVTTVATAMAAFVIVTPRTAFSAEQMISQSKVASALHGVNDLLAPTGTSSTDYDSIADTGTVDIRRDGTIHVRTQGAGDIVITLPYTTLAEAGNGGATYRSTNSATVTRPTSDGNAQTLLVAANSSAPTSYPFIVSNGYVVALQSGGLLLLDRNLEPSRIIPSPWARDAVGRTVATSFTVNAHNTEFTQSVTHRIPDVVYPVVADPWVSFWWGPAIFIGGWIVGNWLTSMAGYFIGCGSLITDPCRVR